MTATYLGGGTIGSKIPAGAQAIAAADAALAVSLGELQAKLAGAIAAQASISVSPPSFAAALDFASELSAAATAGISGPSVQVDVTAIAAFVAEVELLLGQLQAQAALVAALKLSFGSAGIHAYLIEGPIGQMGTDLQSQLSAGVPGGSGGAQLGTAVVLVAADGGAIAALRAVFATT